MTLSLVFYPFLLTPPHSRQDSHFLPGTLSSLLITCPISIFPFHFTLYNAKVISPLFQMSCNFLVQKISMAPDTLGLYALVLCLRSGSEAPLLVQFSLLPSLTMPPCSTHCLLDRADSSPWVLCTFFSFYWSDLPPMFTRKNSTHFSLLSWNLASFPKTSCADPSRKGPCLPLNSCSVSWYLTYILMCWAIHPMSWLAWKGLCSRE